MDDEQKIELDIEITIKLTGLISSTLSANLALKSKARSRWVYPGTLLIYRMEVEQLVIFDLYSDEWLTSETSVFRFVLWRFLT